jgi:uncharacterized protein YjbJ (UPF0337 family)
VEWSVLLSSQDSFTATVSFERAEKLPHWEDPNMMKPSTRDNVEGTVREVNGNIKEAAGKLIKNPKLENAGKREKTSGKGQKINASVEKSIGK